jgi:WD40 repeat protein
VWNIFHEREANRIDFGSGPINAIRSSTPTPVAIDHTGSRLLMIGPNGGIWDLDSNQQVIRIPQSTRDTGTRYLDAGAVSLDGRYFATVVDDRIIVVSIESGNEVVSLERRHAIFLSFLPDAQRIAFVSGIHRLGERPQLEVWDHRSGESNIMAGLDFDIGTMSVSGDSKLLAIAGTNESINGQYVRIWNLNTREQVAVLRHPQAVTAISFGNTSKYIATGCQDCKVRIWTTAAADVANALKRRITKRLARQDWAKYGVSPYEIPTN